MSALVRAIRKQHQPQATIKAFGAPPAGCSCGAQPADHVDHLLDEIAEVAYQQGEKVAAKRIADGIHGLEQEVQKLLAETHDPALNARRSGALGALQHARTIAQGEPLL